MIGGIGAQAEAPARRREIKWPWSKESIKISKLEKKRVSDSVLKAIKQGLPVLGVWFYIAGLSCMLADKQSSKVCWQASLCCFKIHGPYMEPITIYMWSDIHWDGPAKPAYVPAGHAAQTAEEEAPGASLAWGYEWVHVRVRRQAQVSMLFSAWVNTSPPLIMCFKF